MTTNGSNFRGLWYFCGGSDESIIEDDDIYSNDIYAILKTYGVEMARAAILREVSGVFNAYKIDVDNRHLELIADYMVRNLSSWFVLRRFNNFGPDRHMMVATSHLTEWAYHLTLLHY